MITEVTINENERIVFEDLYEKRAALNNIIFVCENNELIRNEELYQRFLKDYQQLEHDYQQCWKTVCNKYQIEELDGYYLHLDFSKSKISLQPDTAPTPK